jgi:polysaccharide pyruvyl transferase WcaK-like protein
VPYEHKAAGLMAAAGLSEFAVDLDDVTPERLAEVAAELWDRQEEIRETLRRTEPALRELSGRTSDLMVELLD